jgi:hypothetical protein
LQNNNIKKLGLFVVGLAALILFAGVAEASYGVTTEGVLECTNKYRRMYDLSDLSLNKNLSEVALKKLDDMGEYKYWAHTNPDTGKEPWDFFKEVGYDYYTAGENLAFDFQTAEKACDSWMKSPTHRSNLLDDTYQEIGVAIRHTNLEVGDGNLIVQIFGSRGDFITEHAAVDQEICYERGLNGMEIVSPRCGITNKPQPLLEVNVPKEDTEVSIHINEEKFKGKILAKKKTRIGRWAENEKLKEGDNIISIEDKENKDGVTSGVLLDTIPPEIIEDEIKIEQKTEEEMLIFNITAKLEDENGIKNAYAAYKYLGGDYIIKDFQLLGEDYYTAQIKFPMIDKKNHPVILKVYDEANNLTEQNLVLEGTEEKNPQEIKEMYVKISLVFLGLISMLIFGVNLVHSYKFGVFDKLHLAVYIVFAIGIKTSIIWLYIELL